MYCHHGELNYYQAQRGICQDFRQINVTKAKISTHITATLKTQYDVLKQTDSEGQEGD
jgi:hypothetical protein